MRYIIVCSIFLAIISGCTLEVAREAGKAIKSIDTTISSAKVKKANEKQNERKKTSKKSNKSEIKLIGKNEEKLFAMLGRPQLIRKDGNIISMRFDEENCLAYTFFDKNSDIKKVEYFEIRTKEGLLLKNDSDVSRCLNKLMQG